jgi:hypothetical protein
VKRLVVIKLALAREIRVAVRRFSAVAPYGVWGEIAAGHILGGGSRM